MKIMLSVFRNQHMQKLYNGKHDLLLLFLLGGMFLSGCRKPPPEFQLTATERHETEAIIPVLVNNCEGKLPILHIYSDQYWGGGYSISNMQPGRYEEPYLSIRKNLWGLYEEQAKGGRPVPLMVPAGTEREFTIVVTRVINRGTVTGEIIDDLKINPQQEAVYRYPIAERIIVDSYRDISCPVDDR